MKLACQREPIFETGLETLAARLDELGLTVEVERDFAGLAAFLGEQNSFVNPTYNPEASDLGAEDFWIRLLDKAGRTVACSAERTFETPNFVDLVATGRVWYRNGYADIGGAERIDVLDVSERIAGRIGTSGSTYTTPDWRRHGLALVMTWYTRLVSFRDLNTAVNTGFVRHSLAQTTVPGQSYGYDKIEPVIDGYWPPQRGHERLYLCWIDRAGMARRVLGLPDHPTNPMPLVGTAAAAAAAPHPVPRAA